MLSADLEAGLGLYSRDRLRLDTGTQERLKEMNLRLLIVAMK